MKALAMPISSRAAADRLFACFCAKSLRMREERSATPWYTRASFSFSFCSAGCITHDAISARVAFCLAGVVKVVQVGYRLAHGEERLVRVERALEEHRQQLRRALLLLAKDFLQVVE